MKRYPFKFLDTYTINDKDIFFGRNDEVDRLYEMIFQSKIMVIYGASGTGKTSLIQCGLSSRFKPYDWLPLFIRRGNDINLSLDQIISETGRFSNDIPSPGHGGQDLGIVQLEEKIEAAYIQSFLPIYLIFDQFEELYLLGEKAEQAAFISNAQKILSSQHPVKMIFVIREEYLGYLYEFEQRVPQLMRKKLRVEPMNYDKVHQVLSGVANYKNSLVTIERKEENEIAQAIFDKIKGKENTLTIQLPYLQVFLDKLYLNITDDKTRRQEATINIKALQNIGDIGNILADFLEEQVQHIRSHISANHGAIGLEIIWKILSPFATLEGTKEPIRKDILYDRLPDLENKLLDDVVDAFVDYRILRLTEKEELYEITHDSLARQIADKRSGEEIALLEVRRLIMSQSILMGQARELFTEKQLNFIDPFLERLHLSEEESQIIDQSREKIESDKELELLQREEELATEKKRRFQATVLAVIGFVLAAISIIAGLLAYQGHKKSELKAREAKALALAAQSRVMYPVDNTVALHLAHAAYETNPTPETAGALNDIFSDPNTQFYNLDILAHTEGVTRVCFSPDGQTFLSGGKDSLARLWDLDGRLLKTFAGHDDWVLSVAFSPDGQTILTGGKDQTARLWDLEGKEINRLEGHSGWVNGASFSPDGQYIATASNDRTAKLWTYDGRFIRSFEGHQATVTGVTFSPNGLNVLSCSFDRTAKLWALNGDLLHSYEGHENFINTVAFAPDGQSIVTGAIGGTARLWELGGTEIMSLTGHEGTLISVVFAPDGQSILTASTDRKAKIWDLNGRVEKTFRGHYDWVHSAVFSPDGKTILTGSLDESIKLWNLGTDQVMDFQGHNGPVSSVAITPDDLSILTTGHDSVARLWNLEGQEIREFRGHEGFITSTAFSPDGNLLITGSQDHTADLWAVGGSLIRSLTDHTDEVNSVAFSPNGRFMVTGSKDGMAIIYSSAGKKLMTLQGHQGSIYSVAFSPDSRSILTGGEDQTARLWNMIGDSLIVFRGHTNFVNSVTFSNDGKYVLTGSGDRTAKLWDLEGKEIRTFAGHSDWVNQAIFTRDNKSVITVSDDKTIRFWNMEGLQIRTINGHDDFIKNVAVSKDGRLILTGSFDGTAKLWYSLDEYVRSDQIAQLDEIQKQKYALIEDD